MNKAFTLVETLVVIVIIVILSLIIIPNYNSTKQQLALQRSAFKLAQDIRIIQEMAISTEELPSGFPPGGYGMYIHIDSEDPTPQNSYILFGDMNDNQKYGPGTDIQIGETKFLEKGVKIKSLSKDQMNIVFMPPDPEVFVAGKNPDDAAWTNFDPGEIVLCLENDETKEITLYVHGTGLVDINY